MPFIFTKNAEEPNEPYPSRSTTAGRIQKWLRKPQIWIAGLLICGLCGLTICPLAYKAGKPFYEGITNYYTGNFRQAIDNYTEVIENSPDNWPAYYLRGLAYNGAHKYKDAIADFTKVIELDPNNAGGYIGRGTAYALLSKSEEAISDLTKGIELDSTSAEAYNSRGWAYYGILQFDQAIEDYNKAIELDPNYFYAYLNRGKVYHRIFVSAYLNEETTYANSKELQQTVKDFEQYLELAPENDSERQRTLRLVEDLKLSLEP